MARADLRIRESVSDDPLRAFRASEAARTAVLSEAPVFDVDVWLRHSVPSTTEELADLEEFLLEREQERLESLRSELHSSGGSDAL